MSPIRSALYFLLALFSTTIGAVTGMGGGVIIKPVLDMLGDYSTGSVSMLSSITVFTMATVSLWRQRKHEDNRAAAFYLPLAAGSVMGGVLGSALLHVCITNSTHAGKITVIQNIILAVLIVCIFVYMQKKQKLKGLALSGGLCAVAAGLLMGALSSFLGIGGGPVNVALLIFAFGLSTKSAVFHSLITIFFSQASKLLMTTFSGGFAGYNLTMLPPMLAGALLGGLIGSALYRHIDENATARLFTAAQIIVFGMCVVNIIRYG